MKQKREKIYFYCIISAAILLRCLSYFRNRSLFYDEINLARNYAEKDYFSLLGNLDYNQHAPPFFNWLVKFSTDILGMNEYALRLFPFLAGVISILLFYKIAQYFLEGYGLAFALVLFGFSSYLLEYGTEVKQYSTDVFWCCVLLFSVLRIKEINPVFWSALGAVVIWFSMPAVFVLAGVGLCFLWQNRVVMELSSRGSKSACRFSTESFRYQLYNPYYGGGAGHQQLPTGNISSLKLASIFTSWLISFGVLYWINLRHSLDSHHLEGFHNTFFLKIDNLAQTGEILVGIIRSIVGRTAVPIIFSFGSFLLGCYTLFQKNKAYFLLLFMPIFLCLFASFLQRYSLIVRLTVFFFPMLILLISVGFSRLYAYSLSFRKSSRPTALVLLAVLAILCFAGRTALPYIFKPLTKEDGRTVLEKLTEQDLSNSTLLVTDCGKPSFLFYTKYCEPNIQIRAEQVIIQEEYSPLTPFTKRISDNSFWLFDSHTFGENYEALRSEINAAHKIQEEIKSKSAFAVFLEKKE